MVNSSVFQLKDSSNKICKSYCMYIFDDELINEIA